MGSGNSRLNSAEGESVSNKIRSTLIGRFEEFRKRRNAGATLSKKELLKDSEQGDGVSIISQSSFREINETEVRKDSASTKEEPTVPLATKEKISRVVPMENSECKTTEEKEEKININKDIDLREEKVVDSNEKVEAEIKTEEGNIEGIVEEVKEEKMVEVKEEKNEQEVSEKNGENDDNDSDDDDEDDDDEVGRFLYQGSPSFRIYCTEADTRKEEEEEECKSSNIVVMHQKSRSADSVVQSVAARKTKISNEVINFLLKSCFQAIHNRNYCSHNKYSIKPNSHNE